MKPVDYKCPVCGAGLSLNWHKGKPVDYCPDHGGTDENGDWVYADGYDESTTFRKDDPGESLNRSTTNRITGSNARSGAEMPVGSGTILTTPA